MTITNTASRVKIAITGTLNETFTVPYPFPANEDLEVYEEDSTGATTAKTLGVDYSVTGAGKPTGGTVTWIGTPTAGDDMHIDRWLDATQPATLPKVGRIVVESIETGLDRSIMLVQQVLERMGGVDFVIGLTGFLGRVAGQTKKWDAENEVIANLADAAGVLDAMNKQSVQALISGTGQLPPPGPGAAGFVLTAIDATSSAFKDRGVPVPVGADVDKLLQATAAGEGNYVWGLKLPKPVAADLGKYARATLADVGSWEEPADLDNRLLNGNFDVAQRGTAFDATTTPANNDDTVLLDCWRLLCEVNDDVDVAQVIAGTGAEPASHAVQLTFNAKNKAGMSQIIENLDSLELIRGKVSLSLAAQITGAVGVKLKMMLVRWTGAADLPTTDIVDVWGAEDTDPTLVTSWDKIGQASLTLTAAWQTLVLEDQTIPAGATNVGILIWMDSRDTIVVNDTVRIMKVPLHHGSYALPHKRLPIAQELVRCQRFRRKTFNQTVNPAQNAGAAGALSTMGAADGEFTFDWRFGVPMRKAPTVTTFNPSAANASARNIPDGTDEPVSVANPGTDGVEILATAADATHASDRMKIHALALAEF